MAGVWIVKISTQPQKNSQASRAWAPGEAGKLGPIMVDLGFRSLRWWAEAARLVWSLGQQVNHYSDVHGCHWLSEAFKHHLGFVCFASIGSLGNSGIFRHIRLEKSTPITYGYTMIYIYVYSWDQLIEATFWFPSHRCEWIAMAGTWWKRLPGWIRSMVKILATLAIIER